MVTHHDPDTPPAASSHPGLTQRALVPAGQSTLVAVGGYVAVEATSLGLWTRLGPGPGLLPLILGVALIVLTAVWVIQTVAERRRAADDDNVERESAKPLDRHYSLGVVGGLIALAALMGVLGFQISMAVFLFAELTLLGRQRWWIAAAIAAVGSVGVFVLFDRVLAVQLPLSSLPALSGLGL
jgi:putative tricarboxylic transport membrane protein